MQLDGRVEPLVFAAYGAVDKLTAMLARKKKHRRGFLGPCFGGSRYARVRWLVPRVIVRIAG